MATASHGATVDRGQVVSTVNTCAFEVIGTRVSSDVPLMEAGVDSLAAGELAGALGRELNVELPATLLFDHPSVDGIVSLMVQELGNTGAPASASGAAVDSSRLMSTVSSCAFAVLGTKVSGDVPLMEAGVDSLAASELSGAIGKELDVELPATLLFDHPSIDGIVSLMVQELGNTGAPASASGAVVDSSRLVSTVSSCA